MQGRAEACCGLAWCRLDASCARCTARHAITEYSQALQKTGPNSLLQAEACRLRRASRTVTKPKLLGV